MAANFGPPRAAKVKTGLENGGFDFRRGGPKKCAILAQTLIAVLLDFTSAVLQDVDPGRVLLVGQL